MHHDEMMFCMNQCRYALMPTRRDTQGVMSCELVTYGIPLITSDLSVCREIFAGIKTVAYIDNDESMNIDLDRICEELCTRDAKTQRFGYMNTVRKEDIIKGSL